MTVLPVLLFILFLLTDPKTGKTGALNGILLTGKTIIPALFPFTVCVLFFINLPLPMFFQEIFTHIGKIFYMTGEEFFIFLLSFTGGYPIGAKLLESSVNDGIISPKKAERMLHACIHSGPAFLVLAVGESLFGSKEIGYLLLFAELLSGIVLALFVRLEPMRISENHLKKKHFSIPDNFVFSVTEGASAVLKIGAYVVLFSVITAYGKKTTAIFPVVRYLIPLFEITCGIQETKNIYLIAFLLGFGGLSVWCQVLSFAKKIPIKPIRFVLFRCFHGILFLAFLKTEIIIFKPNISVFNNFQINVMKPFYSSVSLFFSLLMTVILLFLFINGKKEGRNLQNDMI